MDVLSACSLRTGRGRNGKRSYCSRVQRQTRPKRGVDGVEEEFWGVGRGREKKVQDLDEALERRVGRGVWFVVGSRRSQSSGELEDRRC